MLAKMRLFLCKCLTFIQAHNVYASTHIFLQAHIFLHAQIFCMSTLVTPHTHTHTLLNCHACKHPHTPSFPHKGSCGSEHKSGVHSSDREQGKKVNRLKTFKIEKLNLREVIIFLIDDF